MRKHKVLVFAYILLSALFPGCAREHDLIRDDTSMSRILLSDKEHTVGYESESEQNQKAGIKVFNGSVLDVQKKLRSLPKLMTLAIVFHQKLNHDVRFV